MTNKDLLEKLDFKKGNGLIPVIVQDTKTKEVLMQAYANRQAVEHTIKTGKGTYWSRSRKELWIKGETSGTPKKLFPFQLTAITTHSFMWLSRQVPHATQANIPASLTNYYE